MKSVLIAIQPYWVFLIIAKTMGWKIDQEKTVEVRKNFPKDLNWNRKSIIYCSKNKKSFNRIPKEYQPLMEKFLGRIIGEFVCDTIHEFTKAFFDEQEPQDTEEIGFWLDQFELSYNELSSYVGTKDFYGWHISNLVIYDKPKELREFEPVCKYNMDCECVYWDECKHKAITTDWGYVANMCNKKITRPPQSWCYVEELGV